jgi:catechol 2,3-dioxygenase-like lactoylglutathione lyase family enzyme
MAGQCIGRIALLVKNYDEAKEWYCDVLGFGLVEDAPMPNGKRWVLLAPPGSTETRILLAQAATSDQSKIVGHQAEGLVFLFLHIEDFWADFRSMKEKGVHFCEEPRQENYGTVAMFEDLYGNRWDLLQPKAGTVEHPQRNLK